MLTVEFTPIATLHYESNAWTQKGYHNKFSFFIPCHPLARPGCSPCEGVLTAAVPPHELREPLAGSIPSCTCEKEKQWGRLQVARIQNMQSLLSTPWNLASYPRQRAIVTKRVEFFMFVQIIHDVIQCWAVGAEMIFVRNCNWNPCGTWQGRKQNIRRRCFAGYLQNYFHIIKTSNNILL